MAGNFVIFDMDGTLSDCSHRIHLAQSKQWDEFQSLAHQDAVIEDIADLLRFISPRARPIILTGRNERYRYITEKWLEDSALAGFYDELIMRPDGNFQPDHEYKISALTTRFGNWQEVIENVWFVIDDRDSVVEALRNAGLTVIQPAAGGY